MDQHLFTKIIVILYFTNVMWYISKGMYGNAYYWFAAANITIAATWFMEFK